MLNDRRTSPVSEAISVRKSNSTQISGESSKSLKQKVIVGIVSNLEGFKIVAPKARATRKEEYVVANKKRQVSPSMQTANLPL
jgi:hypothetical protein